MVTKIWDSTSNNEIITWSKAKGLDRHRVRQNVLQKHFMISGKIFSS